jgi:hypothetical protein
MWTLAICSPRWQHVYNREANQKNLKVIKVVEVEKDDDYYVYIEGERERVQNDEQIHM